MNTINKHIFITLFFALFISVTGMGIIVPLLPVYAHELGANGFSIGLIFGAFSISRTVFLPYFGSLSDKHGRKPFIVIGLFCYSVISIAYILSHDIKSIISIRFIQGIASAMIMPAIQAYAGELTPKGSEGFMMGIFNMSMFFGLTAGPLLGGFIKDKLGINTAFAFMGIMAGIGFLLSVFLLPKTKDEKVIMYKTEPVSLKVLIHDKELLGLFIFRFTHTACIGIIWSFMPVFASSEFLISSSSIGILVMLGVFISGLLNTPMGFLSDRYNKKIMIILGGILTAYGILSLKWANGFWDIFWANLIFGFGGGIATPPMMAIAVLKGFKNDSMGSVMSFMTMAHSAGMLVGSILSGFIMDIINLRFAFFIGSLVMILGVFLYVLNIIMDYKD